MVIWIDRELYIVGSVEDQNRRHRINIDTVLENVVSLKNPDTKIRMLTNPYNSLVVKIDIIEYDESYGTEIAKEVATVEGLTERTQAKLLKAADYTEHGRFW